MKRNVFLEMAAAPGWMTAKRWYHGTSVKAAADGIKKSGLVPPDLSGRKGALRPVEGKVYLTSSVRYGAIYAIGGNVLGSSSWKFPADEPTGWMFVVDGSSLGDVQPDEDQIGEIIYHLARGGGAFELSDHADVPAETATGLGWLLRLAKSSLTPRQMAKVADGEYSAWAMAGKKLLPLMSDQMKLNVLATGCSVAHGGALRPSGVWEIEKSQCHELKKDGSNFFDVAKYERL